MNFKLSGQAPVNAYFVFEKEKEWPGFTGRADEIKAFMQPDGQGEIYIGLGEKEALHADILRRQAHQLGRLVKKEHIESLAVHLIDFKNETAGHALCAMKAVHHIVEGLLQSAYVFTHYKKEEHPFSPEIILLSRPGYEEKTEIALNEMQNLMAGVNLTRDLVNTPSNDLYPQTLVAEIEKAFADLPVTIEVYDEAQIRERRMDAFYAVAQGSERPPRFIQLHYHPLADQKPVVLVGKGLTYDSGGYAIKDPKGMATMKSDMGGAATVVGVLYALAKNKIQKNVTGVIAACENMISGGAYKNGDILSSMKGLTIEIDNTDAEGRLTLADALYFAATELDSEEIIDMATLTGAAIVALGQRTAALFSNDDVLAQALLKAADDMGEGCHRLPITEEMRDANKGQVSDLKNCAIRWGGSILAAAFLENFVENKKWAHLDIAGPAYTDSAYHYLPAYATGVPVKTLYKYLFDHSDSKREMPLS